MAWRYGLASLLILSVVALLSYTPRHQARARLFFGGGGPPFLCSDSQPAPAAVWGYNREVFCANSLSQIDVTNTGASGFALYTKTGWPGLAAGNSQWDSFAPTPGSYFSAVGGGGFQILPTGTVNTGINLASCATNGAAGQWVGNAFTGGRYVKIVFGSVPSGRGADTWWPVAPWEFPTEFTAAVSPGPAAGFMENDVFESLLSDGTWVANIVRWNGNGSTQLGSNAYQRDQGGGGSHTNQTYGSLIVDPARNSGTGIVAGYFNDVINPTTPNTVNFTTADQYYQLITQHFCENLTTGSGQAMIVKSLQVWQQ